jgi:hypothetical protein
LLNVEKNVLTLKPVQAPLKVKLALWKVVLVVLVITVFSIFVKIFDNEFNRSGFNNEKVSGPITAEVDAIEAKNEFLTPISLIKSFKFVTYEDLIIPGLVVLISPVK